MAQTGNYTQRFFRLLAVLQELSDAQHPMTQADLVRAMAERGFQIDRRSVGKAMEEMLAAGCPVAYSHGWYYLHDFTHEEIVFLRMLLNGGCYLPDDQRQRLSAGLDALARGKPLPRACEPLRRPTGPDLMGTLNTIYRAMTIGHQLVIHYGHWDADKQLHPVLNRAGVEKNYVVTPCRLVTSNGRWYLIGTVNKHEDLCHFRADRILYARVRRNRKPVVQKYMTPERMEELDNYVNRHPYMYSGEPQDYRVRVPRSEIDNVLDWFGMDTEFETVTDDEAVARVKADADSMKFWLKRYPKAKLLRSRRKKKA